MELHVVVGEFAPFGKMLRGKKPRWYAKLGDDPWRQASRVDIEHSREAIDVTSDRPTLDRGARWEDGHGHVHTVEPQTYRWRETEPYWCEDCHEDHTDSEAFCPLCGEPLKLPMRPPDGFRRYVGGPVSTTVVVTFLGPDPFLSTEMVWPVVGEVRTYEQSYGLRGTHYVMEVPG